MKKLIFIIVIVYMTFDTFSQCVNCEYTEIGVNTTGASAIGYKTKALNHYTFSAGFDSYASGIGSISMGQYLNSTEGYSIIIGSGYSEYQRFVNDKAHYIMMGTLSTKPTFVISPAPQYTKTGKIGIGDVVFPDAKLHIRADEGEAANIFLEPSVWTNEFNAEIWMGNQLHGISAELDKGLVFKTEHHYLFNQGNMGLGTEEPAAKVHVKDGDIYIEDINRGIIMKSPDGTCWRGTVNNDGQIVFEALEVCPEDGTTSVSEPSPSPSNVKIYPNPAENQITIEISKLSSNSLALEIIDELGRIVKTSIIRDNETTINIDDLRPGIYYCRVSGDRIFNVEKFIKH